jgi:adenine C2-methylase RlmN of 23S rRNA A2503 and tRNA A37
MNKVFTEKVKKQLEEAGYDYAIAVATQAELEAGAACGQLSIIANESEAGAACGQLSIIVNESEE